MNKKLPPDIEAVLNEQIGPKSLCEFLAMELPPREYLLKPAIPKKGLVMVFAPRGIGKTFLALGIGCAVASRGKFLHWQAPKQSKVLLVDGEMAAESLQERLLGVVGSEHSTA